jgi:hypothetical protein
MRRQQLVLDADMKAFSTFADYKNVSSFATAKAIMNEGGSSESYAILRIGWGFKSISVGNVVTGKTSSGADVTGEAMNRAGFFTTRLYVKYDTKETPATSCQVGRLPTKNLVGCK